MVLQKVLTKHLTGNTTVMKKRICLYICTAFITGSIFGQQPAAPVRGQITGKAKIYANKISLRWNINNYQLLKNLCTGGVVIDRLVINASNKAEGGWARVTPQPVKALPLEAFKQYTQPQDSGKLIIAQALYGQSVIKAVSLIERLKQRDEDAQNRHMVVSLYAAISSANALAAGLAWEDNIVADTAKKYVYRLSPATIAAGYKIDTGFIYLVGSDAGAVDNIVLTRAEDRDKSIQLQWPSAYNHFSGYYVYRSTDNKTFEKLTQGIYLPGKDTATGNYVFADKVENDIDYYYKLTAVNAFGETTSTTNTITAKAHDLTPPAPVTLSFTRKEKKLQLSWTKPVDTDLKAIYVIQGRNTTADDTVITEKAIVPQMRNASIDLSGNFSAAYYRLMLVDNAGNVGFSNPVYVFIPDLVPPAVPTGIKGYMDSAGMVHISWKGDSIEALRGYKILMANQEDHVFTLASDLVNDTSYTFQNTTNSLTQNLFVKVVAVDANYNHSKPSNGFKITRPSSIQPVTPVFTRYYSGTDGITLQWAAVKTPGFSHFTVLRKYAEEKSWQSLQATTALSITDTTAQEGREYEYSLTVQDSSGLTSQPAFPVAVKMGSKPHTDVVKLTTAKDDVKHLYTLRWTKPAAAAKFYVLYKNTGKGFEMFTSVPGDQNEYSDTYSKNENTVYALTVQYADNTTSEMIK